MSIMNNKTHTQPLRAVVPEKSPAAAGFTLDERVIRIQSLGRQIARYVEFMCQVANMDNTSAQIKERAVVAFHEQLAIAESQLSRIHDGFRLE